jgi:hypothetical protein
MESSIILLEEHHKWKVMTWLVGLLPAFPSNLGISKGSLVGIVGHVVSCNIGSFVSFLRYGMLREAKYGICIGGKGLVPAMV